jgi:hypothetical protein
MRANLVIRCGFHRLLDLLSKLHRLAPVSLLAYSSRLGSSVMEAVLPFVLFYRILPLYHHHLAIRTIESRLQSVWSHQVLVSRSGSTAQVSVFYTFFDCSTRCEVGFTQRMSCLFFFEATCLEAAFCTSEHRTSRLTVLQCSQSLCLLTS